MSEMEKLLILARAARGRIDAERGAALVDEIGRTYAAPSVARGSLHLSALDLALAQAAAAGARGVGAVVLVQEAIDFDGVVLRELAGEGVPVHIFSPEGVLLAEASS